MQLCLPIRTSYCSFDLMHNDVTRRDARKECWSSPGRIKQLKMASIEISWTVMTTKTSIPRQDLDFNSFKREGL
jgi:hypothetical protein